MSSSHFNQRQAYAVKNPPLNISIVCRPQHVVSPDLFYIIDESDIDTLSQIDLDCRRAIELKSLPNIRQQDVKLDAPCIYLDSSGRIAHRVKVYKYRRSFCKNRRAYRERCLSNRASILCEHDSEPVLSSDEEEDGTRMTTDNIDVLHVDYGTVSTNVSLSQLYKINQALLETPCLALSCCLGGVEPIDHYWTPDIKHRFRLDYLSSCADTLDPRFGVRPHFRNHSQRYVCQVIKAISCIVNVADLIVDCRLATRSRFLESITHYGPINPLDNANWNHTHADCDEPDFGTENDLMKEKFAHLNSEVAITAMDSFDVPKMNLDDRIMIDTRATLAKMLHRFENSRNSKLGSLVRIQIVHFRDPDMFFYQLLDEKVQIAFVNLSREIELYFNASSKGQTHLPLAKRRHKLQPECAPMVTVEFGKPMAELNDEKTAQVSKYVIIELSHDQGARHLYYRGIMTSKVKLFKEETYYEHEVYLYDIGSYIYVPAKRILVALREHFHHPSFALPGRFYGIKPLVSQVTTCEQQWSARTLGYLSISLNSETSGSNLYAYVHKASGGDNIMSPKHVTEIELFVLKTARPDPTQAPMHIYSSLTKKLLVFKMIELDTKARHGRPSGNLHESE